MELLGFLTWFKNPELLSIRIRDGDEFPIHNFLRVNCELCIPVGCCTDLSWFDVLQCGRRCAGGENLLCTQLLFLY